MRRAQGMPREWERWTHRLGWSAKRGEVRADLSPMRDHDTGLVMWLARIWRGAARDQPLMDIWRSTPWAAAEDAWDEMGRLA